MPLNDRIEPLVPRSRRGVPAAEATACEQQLSTPYAPRFW